MKRSNPRWKVGFSGIKWRAQERVNMWMKENIFNFFSLRNYWLFKENTINWNLNKNLKKEKKDPPTHTQIKEI